MTRNAADDAMHLHISTAQHKHNSIHYKCVRTRCPLQAYIFPSHSMYTISAAYATYNVSVRYTAYLMCKYIASSAALPVMCATHPFLVCVKTLRILVLYYLYFDLAAPPNRILLSDSCRAFRFSSMGAGRASRSLGGRQAPVTVVPFQPPSRANSQPPYGH